MKSLNINLATLNTDFHYVAQLASRECLDVVSVAKDKHRPFYLVTFSTGETFSYNQHGINQFRPNCNIVRLTPVMERQRTWKEIFASMFAGTTA